MTDTEHHSHATAGTRGVLGLVVCAQFMITIDVSIVNVALPSIGAALHLSRADLSWVVNAYSLTFGGLLLLGGRLSDVLGRRRMFMAGLTVFSVASLAGGLAPLPAWLLAARAVQGVGAAIIAPATLSIISTSFDEGPPRNRAMGVWGAVAGLGGAAGVLLGGILTSGLGWRWVLFVNVPIGAAALLAAPRLLSADRTSQPQPRTARIDLPGAVTGTAGLSLLVFAAAQASAAGWGSAQTLGCLAGAVVLLALFVGVESRQSEPLLPLSLLRNASVRAANLIRVLNAAYLYAMFYFVSLYLQQILGQTPIQAGLSYLPLALTIFIAARLSSRLIAATGAKPLLIAGLLLSAAGLAWFSHAPAHGGSFLASVLGPSLVAAVGIGLTIVPVTIAAMAGVDPRQSGVASGLVNTSQQVGGALGLAVLASVAAGHAQAHRSATTAAAVTSGFDLAFQVAAAIAVAAAVAATVLISAKRKPTRHAHRHRSADPTT
jgi:EmrB/QacA subfamily drug resistance transporter